MSSLLKDLSSWREQNRRVKSHFPIEIKLKAIEAFAAGYRMKEIAMACGVGVETLKSWYVQRDQWEKKKPNSRVEASDCMTELKPVQVSMSEMTAPADRTASIELANGIEMRVPQDLLLAALKSWLDLS